MSKKEFIARRASEPRLSRSLIAASLSRNSSASPDPTPAIQLSTISFRSRHASRSGQGVDVGNGVAVGLGVGVLVGGGVGRGDSVGGGMFVGIAVGTGAGFGVSVALRTITGMVVEVGLFDLFGRGVVSRSMMPKPSKIAVTTNKPMITAISDAIVMAHPFRHLRIFEDRAVSDESELID